MGGGGDGDQITSANIALVAWGKEGASIVRSAVTTDTETVLLCSAAHCSEAKTNYLTVYSLFKIEMHRPVLT